MDNEVQDCLVSLVLVLHLDNFLVHCLQQECPGWDHIYFCLLVLMEFAAQSSKRINMDTSFLPEELSPIRKGDLDQCDEADEQTAPAGRGFSAKLSTSVSKPQKWAILDGLWLILSSTYLLYVSLFLWLNAVVSSFFYFQKVTVIATSVTSPTGRRRLFAQINSLIAVFILAGQLTLTLWKDLI